MFFTEQALADLQRELQSVPSKVAALQERYFRHEFHETRAREFALHGFMRRLNTLARCIENVFTLIPPERVEPVEREVRRDTEINIQASVFNTFAAVDNLAWIWVVEKAVTRANGLALPETQVGLRPNNRDVRAALPNDLRESLERMDEWFDVLDNYRHALAHRIPLYIPPYIVDPSNMAAHADLGTRILEALVDGDLAAHERLRDEQSRMEFFEPLMNHSFEESAHPLIFHPQLLTNFNTIEDLGGMMLDALITQRHCDP